MPSSLPPEVRFCMRSRIVRSALGATVAAVLTLGAVGASSPVAFATQPAAQVAPPRFDVVLPATARQAPLTGRLVVIVSRVASGGTGNLPRMLSPNFSGPALYAIDLDQLRPGQTAVVDQRAVAYPKPMAELPAGEYAVQARVNAYTQVRRGDGHTLWVHTNDGTVSQSQFG